MTSYIPYLWQRMQALHDRQPLSGHTPGHKNGLFLPEPLQKAWGSQFASYDYTELDGLDNLHFASDCIAQSQQQAAQIFGVGQCFYLVNGTTAGLQAAIMATCSGKQVFVPRHVHRSVYHSLLLAHAQPVYLPLELDARTSLPLGISTDTLQQYMQQYPDCKNLILVNPTYQGITADNAACVQLAKDQGLTVIVDEAHGSHLHFHRDLPASLLDAGADLVVQSWHKTLPVMTQGSALLVHKQYQGPSPEPFLSLLQTTSPSYLLMASLEAGSIYMGQQVQAHIDQSLQVIFELHSRITNTLQTLHVLWEPEWKQDPFKLYLLSDRLSGANMDAYLRQHHAIYSEMHDNSGILFILPLQTSVSWAERLYQALLDLDRFSLQQQTTHQTQASFYCRTIPRQCYPLQEAFYRKKQQLHWREAAGAIAGQFILRYPPGIPLLVPGEMITREIVQLWLASGGTEDELVTVLAQ
ncbi:MAG: aminotransferase class I/II-fold pyridoxal phosphate-dependent enzyme [Peptococcaceae bacterium]